MSTLKGTGHIQQMLNHMTPAANAARLGDVLANLIVNVNAIVAALQATTATGLVTTSLVTLPTIENPGAPGITNDYP
jgi:hypothetical protein